MPQKLKVISTEEVKSLNDKGFDLDEKKFYALAFLVNDKENNAVQPIPFKVASSFVEPLTKTGIGKPWIPNIHPEGIHIKPPNAKNIQDILDFQRKFAGGVMRGYFVNPVNNNASVIIEIFPSYKDIAKQEDQFVSPMIGNPEFDSKGEVFKGEILHIHSVDISGYDPDIAKFLGTCEGDFNECARELEPLAAAGVLEDYRNSTISCPKKFLNTLAAKGNQMADNENGIPVEIPHVNGGDTSEGETKILEAVTEIKSKIDTIEQSQEIMKEVVMDVAVAAAGVDENKIKEKLGMAAAGDETDPPKDENPNQTLSASGQKLEKISKENSENKKLLEEIQKERTQEKLDYTTKERERQVRLIVKSEIITHQLPIEDKDKRTKELLEMADPKDKESLRDISLLAELAEKQITSTLPEDITLSAAGGDDYYSIPDTTNFDAKSAEAEIMESL